MCSGRSCGSSRFSAASCVSIFLTVLSLIVKPANTWWHDNLPKHSHSRCCVAQWSWPAVTWEVFEQVTGGTTHPPMKSLIPCDSKECQRRFRLIRVIHNSTISVIVPSECCWFSHLQLLGVFLLPQFEAELVGGALQPADLLRGLSQRLLQLLELLLFLLLQFALDALLLLQQEVPQAAELCWDQLLQISGSLLCDSNVVKGFCSVLFCL